MHDSKRDVAYLLHEEAETCSICKYLRQQHRHSRRTRGKIEILGNDENFSTAVTSKYVIFFACYGVGYSTINRYTAVVLLPL